MVDRPLHADLGEPRDPAALGREHEVMDGDLPVLLAGGLLRQGYDVVGRIAQGPQGAAIDDDRLVKGALPALRLHGGFRPPPCKEDKGLLPNSPPR